MTEQSSGQHPSFIQITRPIYFRTSKLNQSSDQGIKSTEISFSSLLPYWWKNFGFQTYNYGVNRGRSKERLDSVLHQNSGPVHQGPVLQVVPPPVPEADESKRQTSGYDLRQRAVSCTPQRHVDVSETWAYDMKQISTYAVRINIILWLFRGDYKESKFFLKAVKEDRKVSKLQMLNYIRLEMNTAVHQWVSKNSRHRNAHVHWFFN